MSPSTTTKAAPWLRFDVITLFPDFFEPWRTQGVCGRALGRGLAEVICWNPRQFTQDVHQTVDDRPYGGGPGMVMMAEPLAAAVEAIRADCVTAGWTPGSVVLFSPTGRPFDQSWVEARLAENEVAGPQQFTLVCGRYEGIDQRFQDHYVNEVLSLGDFVLSGGEVAALALMDATVRRLPGALGHDQSSVQDSFMAGLLDHPHYTRPEIFEGEAVPDVLLSGHHGRIADWRRKKALSLTAANRPDLIEQARARGLLSPRDEADLLS